MSVKPVGQVPVTLLTDAQIALVNQHVPEGAFKLSPLRERANDWHVQIPMISQLVDFEKPNLPKEFHYRLFWSTQFMNSNKEVVKGVALSLFFENQKNEAQRSSKWKFESVAFQNKQCVGFYAVAMSHEGRLDCLAKQDAQGLTDLENEMNEGLNLLSCHLGAAKEAQRQALNAKSGAPAAKNLHNADPIEDEQLDGEQPIDERAWYQKITDAFCDCIWNFIDCFKRFFGFAT